MWRDLSRPCNQRVFLLCGWELLIVSHHPAKFDGHRQCGSGDIDVPANLVILLQIWDICDCICLPTSGILIFCIAPGMSHATDVLNNNLRNNELTLIVVKCFSVLLKDVLICNIHCKKVLEATKLGFANKTGKSITFWPLGFGSFCWIINSVLWICNSSSI